MNLSLCIFQVLVCAPAMASQGGAEPLADPRLGAGDGQLAYPGASHAAANDTNEAIQVAAEEGDAERLRVLLKNPGLDPGADDNRAIYYAAQAGHTECLKRLLEDPRVDPSAGNNDAIYWASSNGHAGCVKLLLTHPKVDPSAVGNISIIAAAEHGHVECVKLLLKDPRVNPADGHNCAIRSAARNDHVACVRLLLAHPSVDPADKDDYALYWAAENGNIECVNALLEDPRVNPQKHISIYAPRPVVCPISCAREYSNGYMMVAQSKDLTNLFEVELDILVFRNRESRLVLSYLFEFQLARLGIPGEAQRSPAYKALAAVAISKRGVRTSDLRKIINLFSICQMLWRSDLG